MAPKERPKRSRIESKKKNPSKRDYDKIYSSQQENDPALEHEEYIAEEDYEKEVPKN